MGGGVFNDSWDEEVGLQAFKELWGVVEHGYFRRENGL
ncbi:MAG: hypothetical protein C5S48_09335 [Candidatus Methanogaster sp.]|nr:MAG: hypothetical protein C5S48_09335 [ANME-2 cluster archaeon]